MIKLIIAGVAVAVGLIALVLGGGLLCYIDTVLRNRREH
jgi:hypothetical protein